ncbi:DUF2937 family protein [Salaquimonas pukyongi]|uniref:DUF2937 family protein n=1 Tax=Salaquimonas pukyongi TaxID=2712698 RepID=UPI00096B7B59|nr:DUF2937 family protein [Salaquimonas pukyongi]
MPVKATARILTITGALAGGAVTSQAPEFAQQYRQRIGGALQELQAVVADFDKDAAASQMTREGALTRYSRSSDKFVRDRGASMDKVLLRYDRLEQQRQALETAIPLMKPLHVIQYADPALVEGTWEDFRPAVPLTAEGGAYAAGGAVSGWLLIGLVFGFFGWIWRALAGRKKNDIVIEDPAVRMETGEAAGAGIEPANTVLTPPSGVKSAQPTSLLERPPASSRQGE